MAPKLPQVGMILAVLLVCNGVSSLKLLELHVPTHVILGTRTLLSCRWVLQPNEMLYSVKWYKDGDEFFTYLPQNTITKKKYYLPGVKVENSSRNGGNLTLQRAVVATAGRYYCEVTGDKPYFHTALASSDMVVVAMPENGPIITGSWPYYRTDDRVQVNCTSGRTHPASQLTWYINKEPAPQQFVLHPTHLTDEDGLETTSIALEFKVKPEHFKEGNLKLTCLATVSEIYWRSAEEGVSKRGLKDLTMLLEHEGSEADRVRDAELTLILYLLTAWAILFVGQ